MSFDIEINVECNECGESLEADYSSGDLYITPCQICLDEVVEETLDDIDTIKQESYDEGYQAAKEEDEEERKEKEETE